MTTIAYLIKKKLKIKNVITEMMKRKLIDEKI